MTQDSMKQAAAKAAVDLIDYDSIVGVGTGSTVNYFIDALAQVKGKIKAAVASSKATAEKLRALNIPLEDLNSVGEVKLYVDGADEFNDHFYLIKGGGGALTREKIIAQAASKFVVIADDTKHVQVLGKFPLPIEVIPMARSLVARELVKLGGDPVYREGFVTDNGNVILDVYNLEILNPVKLEADINNIVGVVTNGIFAARSADLILIGTANGLKNISNNTKTFER